MVSFNQDNLSIQALAQKDVLFLAHGEIPKEINDVLWTNYGVPIGNQSLIHFGNIGEWTVAVLKNIFVTKVKVARKEDFHKGIVQKIKTGPIKGPFIIAIWC
jgi:hypothetical protein